MNYSYVAGFFDGEGTICICNDKRKGERFYLNMINTNKEVLEKIKGFLGFGYIYLRRRNDRNKIQYTLVITKQQEQKIFLDGILPYSIIKKEKSLRALEWLYVKRKQKFRQGKLFKCCKCNKLLPKEEFGKNNTSKHGIEYYCLDCAKKYREQRKRNVC